MAFQEDPPAREPFLRVPASVVGLIGVLALAHVARILSPNPDAIADAWALYPAAYALPAGPVLRLATPFTHMFLHADWTHLIVNSVWLLAFGPVVARRFGGPAFIVFFLLCGLGGAALFVAMDWGLPVGAIGASGAISGLMGAAIRMMDIRQPYLNVATQPLLPLFSRQVLMFSAVWLVVNLLTALLGLGLIGPGQEIAWQDHMGGYLAGLVLAGPFERYVGHAARIRRLVS